MKHLIVKATFKGANNSLGYKTGTGYILKLSQAGSGWVDIHDMERNSGYCKYESMHSFFKNWNYITDVTDTELKYSKSVVKSFPDLCETFVRDNNSATRFTLSVKKALSFYNEEFTVEKVVDCFKNWSITKKPNLELIVLTNSHEKKSRISIDTSAHNFGYCFLIDISISKEDEENSWYPLPKTMGEFISDCLRHSEFEMIFTDKAIKKIF